MAASWLIAAPVLGEGGEPDGRAVKGILKARCYACHAAFKQEGGLRLDSVEWMVKGGDSGRAVVPGNPAASPLWQRVSSGDNDTRMPPEGDPLSAEELKRIQRWIKAGAAPPAGDQPQPDPRRHWAFQPLQEAPPAAGPAHAVIDRMIDSRLAQAGLRRAPRASRPALIRRLYLDMHGLLPPLEAVDAFVADRRPDAYQRVVDQVLASPRYGERWAQHWLDIVRYADTHGFEVNTPRENAWPYRNYVIDALNADKPYNQFVFEQLAGDTVQQDPATGFLVAAAVLLPGQIGKDEASKRLARQDSLDEIVVGVSNTFLALTIGCARCHDHKFDPIAQSDYYSLQAFFAGVDYGERAWGGTLSRGEAERASALAAEINQLKSALAAMQPLASPHEILVIDDEDARRTTHLRTKNGHGENPAGTGRGYRDDPGDAQRLPNVSRGRYTWWPNVAGQDVFAYQPDVSGKFRIWLSWGVHGSGVHTSDARYLIDRDGDLQTSDDQREIARVNQLRFAYQADGQAEQKPLWSGLYYAGEFALQKTSRILVRGGDTGTGITADALVLQRSALPDSPAASDTSRARPVAGDRARPQARGPVDPRQNTERFAPVRAKYVRFVVEQTLNQNFREPCLDELEVFSCLPPKAGSADAADADDDTADADGDAADADGDAADLPPAGTNVALADRGVRVSSSGDISTTGKHQLKHLNDGRYGNDFSWISDQKGGGWVQLELPAAVWIDRIVWGRDREGKFSDRLPVTYRVEVALQPGQWVTVAGSGDRLPHGTPHDPLASLARGAAPEEQARAREMLARLRTAEQTHRELTQPKMLYAGAFRPPDPTYLLTRGDPEQPAGTVGPAVPQVFPQLDLSTEAGDRERRVSLARWLIQPDNPLPARVIANRIWQYHFGTGLVETPSDFGINGARPSHPLLLDFLARQLIAEGWSLKSLHRSVLLSETYRQSHRIDAHAQEVDADCRLLWRFPSRRLEAEAIRDNILWASGQLNLSRGGPGFDFFQTRGGLSGFPPVTEFGPAQHRRMIYAHKVRMERVPIFGAFDCPDAGQAMPRRSQSTTAIQALNLFNSEFVSEQAERLAAWAKRVHADRKQQINFVFRRVLGRVPGERERDLAATHVERHGLPTLCRVLFNTNEFLFLP